MPISIDTAPLAPAHRAAYPLRRAGLCAVLLVSWLTQQTSPVLAQRGRIEPEPSTGYQTKIQSTARRHMSPPPILSRSPPASRC